MDPIVVELFALGVFMVLVTLIMVAIYGEFKK